MYSVIVKLSAYRSESQHGNSKYSSKYESETDGPRIFLPDSFEQSALNSSQTFARLSLIKTKMGSCNGCYP